MSSSTERKRYNFSPELRGRDVNIVFANGAAYNGMRVPTNITPDLCYLQYDPALGDVVSFEMVESEEAEDVIFDNDQRAAG